MAWEHRFSVAVSGIGMSAITRSAEKPLAALALEAVQRAVADSGLQMDDINGLATYAELPAAGHTIIDGLSIVSVNAMMTMLKLPNLRWHLQNETVNIGGAVQTATNALIAGVCDYVVVWRALHNPTGIYTAPPASHVGGPQQFTAPYGFSGIVQSLAAEYARYLERHGQSREKMAALAIAQRKHANLTPEAYFHDTPLTRDDYLNSRMIAYPFCLFDCDIPVQGAMAMVLTRTDRARDLRPKPALLAGYGQRIKVEVGGRIASVADYMAAGSSSSNLTWERAGLGPQDVDVAQIYDGFAGSTIYGIESYGFAKEGEALDFVQDGNVEISGGLPINTFGGSLSAGRLHGIWHIAEAAMQVSGRAGAHQVPGAKIGFAGASGANINATTFVFADEPY